MDRCRRLLEKARAQPEALRFQELCDLAECFGFVLVRQKGSHRIFKKTGYRMLLNFQTSKGMARAYQVRQLLSVLEESGVP